MFFRSCEGLVNFAALGGMVSSGAGEVSRRPKPVKQEAAGPFWTSRGLLSDQPEAYCARRFTKQERAEEQQAKLRALGFETEIVCGHRRNSLFLRLVPKSEAVEVEVPPVADPVDIRGLRAVRNSRLLAVVYT